MFNLFVPIAQAAVSLPDLTQTTDLGGFISELYKFALIILGIVIFIQFLRVGWMFLTAAGNASVNAKATETLRNAIIGALLLLSAYLILYVINPDLVKIEFNFNSQ